jgi:endonuclease/exonuclease/phosphatase (EEP) superfamily protein YafD
MPYANGGMFDFTAGLIPAATRVQLSWRISDHFPLWVEYLLPS